MYVGNMVNSEEKYFEVQINFLNNKKIYTKDYVNCIIDIFYEFALDINTYIFGSVRLFLAKALLFQSLQSFQKAM